MPQDKPLPPGPPPCPGAAQGAGRRAFLPAHHARYAELAALAADSGDGPLRPERTTRWLAAWHQGEPLARLATGAIGRSLRREGRAEELLALHAALPEPAGGPDRADGPAVAGQGTEANQALHAVAREVLLLPAPPPAAVSRAVDRVEWLLGSAMFRPGDDAWTREAVLHTLALARLRQRQFATAELLCQPALAVLGLPDAQRATVLATVVLANRALGLPYQRELDEALILDPDADLVAEAAGDQLAGRPRPRAC